MVDELGGLRKAIAYAAKEADLGEEVSVRDYPEPTDFIQEFMENLTATASFGTTSAPLRKFEEALEEIKGISQWNDPKGVYAVLPYRIYAD